MLRSPRFGDLPSLILEESAFSWIKLVANLGVLQIKVQVFNHFKSLIVLIDYLKPEGRSRSNCYREPKNGKEQSKMPASKVL